MGLMYNMLRVKVILVFFLLILFVQSFSQPKRVLFLGNSYTAYNQLHTMVAGLALAAGEEIHVDKNTPGGYTLGHPDFGHLYNATSLGKIELGDWDYVVLQEQSQFPVIDHFRDYYTYPGAASLDTIIREKNDCAKTMFFMTWGRKIGGQQCIDSYCSVDFVDYAHMQDSMAAAYIFMSNYLNTPVSPVGMAWKKSIVENGDPIELFAGDGSHPSVAGSYLAACTFYASIYHTSPVGLTYTAGLSESDANYLQGVAAETVLNNLEIWNIDTTSVSSAFDYNQDFGEVSFNNLSSSADRYLWDFGNGDTDTTTNPVYNYMESGVFEVSLIAYSGCKTDTSYSSIQIVIADIEDKYDNSFIKVYPNPASDKIGIIIPSKNYQALIKLDIYTTEGSVCYSNVMNGLSGLTEIDISSLKPGVYFLRVESEGKPLGTSKFQIIK
jgi:type IX secretion system substrate protein/uncharacterized protein DUF4886/PKD domain-containing protein